MRLLFLVIFIILASASVILAEGMSASYWYENGKESLKNRSYEEAIAYFDMAIADNPVDWDSWYGKGEALYNLEKYEDGLDLCNRVLSNPKGPKGVNRVRFINLDESFYLASKEINPDSPIKGYSQCSGEIPEIYRSVEKRYDDALELDPNSTLTWNNKGIFLGTICQLDKSIECFSKALDIDPTLAEVWNNKGVSYDWQGKHDESMICYNRAIELKPKMAAAWMNRARTQSLNMSLFAMAQQNASRAVELDSSLENETSQMTWSYIQLF
jgi:tetratricopeptide (TPR) repeat protein